MVSCDSCSILIPAEPVCLEGKLYCCTGCGAGGPCICTYEQDLGRYPPARYARPVSLNELLDRYESGIMEQAWDLRPSSQDEERG